jgi:hypothetical protein
MTIHSPIIVAIIPCFRLFVNTFFASKMQKSGFAVRIVEEMSKKSIMIARKIVKKVGKSIKRTACPESCEDTLLFGYCCSA